MEKRVIVVVAGAMLMIAGTFGLALAHGFGGPGGPGREMFLLARAAGLSHDQIRSKFENDPNLKADRANLKTAHEAMMACVVSGKDCKTEVAAFSNALQTMAQERMTVWQSLFQSAPNSAQASSLYNQLQQLRSQKQQLVKSVLGSNSGPGASGSEAVDE
jgi:hypothetical protein